MLNNFHLGIQRCPVYIILQRRFGKMHSSCCCSLSAVCVFIVIAQILRKVLPWFYENFLGPKFLGPQVDVKKMGDWAVVTGATEGIGKAYAKALAKKGLNLVLISRSKDKLDAVSQEIHENSKVSIKTVAIDFTQGLEIYDRIGTEIDGLDIGVLVNNVGMSYDHPEYFIEHVNKQPHFIDNIIRCNVYSVTHMCKLILPQMVDKKKGVIINISSMSAQIPNPLLSLYSGTKAFVDKFSDDLSTEYKRHGITIQSVLPGFVVSNMSKIKKPTIMAPSADCFVASALRTLGISTHTTGYFPHAMMQLTINMISACSTDSIANNYIFNQLFKTRRRAISAKLRDSKNN